MRLAVASSIVTFSGLIFIAPFAMANDSFPTTAFVANPRTQVRSGPSDDHYVTDRLDRGDEVEVHQRTGGWLAIRPPKSSFSWIAERDVTAESGRSVGIVASEHAVSWIGSNVGEVSDHKWQVRLDEDEPVAILGKQRLKVMADGKSDLYFKIAPPAGEFRWIHEDDIVPSKDEIATQNDSQVELADFRVAIRGKPRAEAVTPPPTPKDSTPPAEDPAPPTPKDDFVGRSANAPAGVGSKEPASFAKDNVPPPLSTDSKDLQTLLTELDARLSLLVAQPVEKWDVSQIRADAQQVAERATSTLERARVQLFIDKVASFESLKTKHALFTPAAATSKTEQPAPTEEIAPEKPSQKEKVDPRFDGTGWLLPVHSTKRAAPPYALLDKEGNILQFVSPAPGLNLNRYLRKEVGIFGQRAQGATLDKPHLTASRVVELDRHRR